MKTEAAAFWKQSSGILNWQRPSPKVPTRGKKATHNPSASCKGWKEQYRPYCKRIVIRGFDLASNYLKDRLKGLFIWLRAVPQLGQLPRWLFYKAFKGTILYTTCSSLRQLKTEWAIDKQKSLKRKRLVKDIHRKIKALFCLFFFKAPTCMEESKGTCECLTPKSQNGKTGKVFNSFSFFLTPPFFFSTHFHFQALRKLSKH